MDIFSNQAGAVAALNSPGVPMSMFLDGWAGYVPMKSIITGFNFSPKSGAQFSHSLREFINVYVFGDRIAPLSLSGVSFAHSCDRADEVLHLGDGSSLFLPNYHGLEYVMSYYNTYRVSTFGAPVTIVLGLSTVLFGFLTECSIGMQDAENRLASFSLTFQSFPQASILDIP